MKKIIGTLLLILIFGPLSACSKTPNKISPLSVGYMDGSTVKLSENISFLLDNPNKVCIIFPYDFAVKVYYEQKGVSREIKNTMDYSPKGDIILDAKGGAFSSQVLTVKLDLTNDKLSGPTNFVARISGHICRTHESFNQEIPFTVIP